MIAASNSWAGDVSANNNTLSGIGQLSIHNSTATTGTSLLTIQNGAGNGSGGNYQMVSFKNSSGSEIAYIDTLGQVISPQFITYAGTVGIQQNISIASGSKVQWSSDSTFYGTPDTAIIRNAAATVEINSGSAGSYGILKAANVRLYASTSAPDSEYGSFHIAGNGSTDTKRLTFGYNTTNEYGWVQSVYSGVAFTPTIINGIAGKVVIGTTTLPSNPNNRGLYVVGDTQFWTESGNPGGVGSFAFFTNNNIGAIRLTNNTGSAKLELANDPSYPGWLLNTYSDPFIFSHAFRLQSSAPSTSSSTGVVGTITWDSSYVYVCTATNTWKRVALSTF